MKPGQYPRLSHKQLCFCVLAPSAIQRAIDSNSLIKKIESLIPALLILPPLRLPIFADTTFSTIQVS